VKKQADDLAHHAASWNSDADSMMSILRSLAATDPEFAATKRVPAQTLFYRAKRLALALDRLTAALNANRGALKIDNELNALRGDVQSSDNFDAARFAEHLRQFRASLR
jgi:hypothetical protein